jgi:hypothetical protein
MMSASPTDPITATSIGLLAHTMLASDLTAAVIGATSRGLFLLLPNNGVVFLSYESWRSPLTVNLGQRYSSLKKVTTGQRARIAAKKIDFLEAEIRIDFELAQIWSAPVRPDPPLTHDQRQVKLRETAGLICKQSSAGFSTILAAFTNLPDAQKLDQDDQAILDRLHQLHGTLSTYDLDAAASLAAGLLGYGRGLTPSGDDLLAGLLLALNRWDYNLAVSGQLSSFNNHLTALAYTQTTALSANILAATASGQADERLIQSVDALYTGSLAPEKISSLLLSYGSSSGIDALLGMALAIALS